MDLVLEGKVTQQDGLWTVQDSTKPYEINGECPCPQGQRAASKWCKHLVAVELWKRAQAIMQPGASNGNGHKPEPSPEPEPEPLPAIPDCQDTRHWTDVLAPICHTVKYVVGGIEHCTVIRGDDMQEVMAQVKQLMATIKKGREAETVPTEDVPVCAEHGVAYRQHTKDGRSWWSHRQGDGWCRKK